MINFLAPRSIFAVAVGFIVSTTVAFASEVDYTYSGETGGGLSMGMNISGDVGNFTVGQVIMTTSTPGFSPTLNSFCTDLNVSMAASALYTPIPITSPQATGVNPIWVPGGGLAAATIWNSYAGTASGVVQLAGLQLAIWELLNNTPTTFTAGSLYSSLNKGFYVTATDANSSNAVNYAVSILNTLNTLTLDTNAIWLAPTDPNTGNIAATSQGLLAQPNTSVPDSASTLILLGMGLFALGLLGKSSAVISSIRGKRSPAYLKIRR
jgi:hypothetical protein